jgi:hypothetical protein
MDKDTGYEYTDGYNDGYSDGREELEEGMAALKDHIRVIEADNREYSIELFILREQIAKMEDSK